MGKIYVSKNKIIKCSILIIKYSIIVSILLNIANSLFVNFIYLVRMPEVDGAETAIGLYAFEVPAPPANQIIKYDELAFAHRMIISREEWEKSYDNDVEYCKLLMKLNFSAAFLPKTTKFYCSNWDDGSFNQGGWLYIFNKKISYNILVISGVNVFTLKPEVTIMFI